MEYYSLAVVDPAGNNQFRFFERRGSGNLYHIPLLAKLDNRWLSLGLGAQLEIADFKTVTLVRTDKLQDGIIPTEISDLGTLDQPETQINASLIGEISIGKVQKGPSVGIKGIIAPNDWDNYNLQLFASWKF